MSDLADLTRSLRFLLLQVRNPDDPMRRHEVEAFARVLECGTERIDVFDLLAEPLTELLMENADMLLLGGSGHYSATDEGAWLERALESLRLVHAVRKPTFASCWGFQAMARAMGGLVVKDLSRAEVGTHRLYLTEAGRSDPVYAPLGESFLGQMGHEDIVEEIPANATLLASSDRVTNQAYRFDDAPIYCTQFHPELTRGDLLIRVVNYPEYIERIAGLPVERFPEMVQETPESEGILKRFVVQCFV
jgi:GMP synthase (glutamine-hydrolysing)